MKDSLFFGEDSQKEIYEEKFDSPSESKNVILVSSAAKGNPNAEVDMKKKRLLRKVNVRATPAPIELFKFDKESDGSTPSEDEEQEEQNGEDLLVIEQQNRKESNELNKGKGRIYI